MKVQLLPRFYPVRNVKKVASKGKSLADHRSAARDEIFWLNLPFAHTVIALIAIISIACRNVYTACHWDMSVMSHGRQKTFTQGA